MGLSTVWVYGEASDGAVSSMTLEMLAKARDIADEVVVIYGGGDADAIAAELGEHGATSVLATGDLDGRLPGPHIGAAVAAAAAANPPALIMFGTTYEGRDVAARVSVALDAPVVTNLVDLTVDGDRVVGTEPIFGGTTEVRTGFTGDKPGIVTVRPKSFAAEATGGSPATVGSLELPDVGAAGGARIHDRFVEESEGPKLDEAEIVVSGGRGLGEAGKYEMIETLAKLVKGAPGATRAIVDAGWVPYSYQVGQTGKVVKPTVYIAAGISGATQHLVGMKGSGNIIAINKDPEAPIFGVADLGVIGDVHKVLPKVIEALENR